MISLLWLFLIGVQASVFLSDEAEILDGRVTHLNNYRRSGANSGPLRAVSIH